MEIDDAVSKLSALSQASRLETFRLLVRTGEKGLSAGEISETTGIKPNTLSFHLKELAHAGLIGSHRDGRHIIYQLKIDGIRDLLHFLTDDCCQGKPELCLPKTSCC